MKRREVIAGLGAVTATWPSDTYAQPGKRMKRVGVLMNIAADDALGTARLGAFLGALEKLGWAEGRDLQIDVRWGGGETNRYRQYATELVALAPDVILASSGATMPALVEATRSVPIVFVQVPDPVGSGFVATLARPGGNATGFTQFEFGLSSKWLEVLKAVAPHVTRAAILRDPADPAGVGQFGAIQAAAPSFGLEARLIDVRDPGEIERGIAAFGAFADGGLVVTGSAPAAIHRELIVALAARYRLPAVYPYRFFSAAGGLLSYGAEVLDQYRRAAGYVDRILKGEKPADLPVQAPTKYELVINLRTAKALGLTIPPTVLARADEVIE